MYYIACNRIRASAIGDYTIIGIVTIRHRKCGCIIGVIRGSGSDGAIHYSAIYIPIVIKGGISGNGYAEVCMTGD